MNRIRKVPLATLVPILLLAGLGLFMLVFVFLQANHYGLTMDEAVENQYGHLVLTWYKTLGRDVSFASYQAPGYVPEHGSIFAVVVALAQHIFGHEWYTRAVVTGLVGITGVVAIALCGYELAGWWGAFLAALALWLYPRYSGAVFTNPKDIPFAAAMTWVLWSVIVLVKRWDRGHSYRKQSIVVGFFIGLAIAIRVTAIMWFMTLALFLVGWYIIYGLRAWRVKKVVPAVLKQSAAGAIIVVTTLLSVLVLWPYILINPIRNLHTALIYMSAYPWNGIVLFNGVNYPVLTLPRYYVPEWLIIGSPPTLILFSLMGIFVACFLAVRKRVFEPQVVVTFFALCVPLSAFVIVHPVVYDALRLFLFLIPPMVLLAVYGGVRVYGYLIARKQKALAAVLVALTMLSYGMVVKDMMDLHPYEYIYFSPLVGGVPGAKDVYNIDYWGACNKPAAEWLAQNYTHYTTSKTPTIEGVLYFEFQDTTYLPANFQVDVKHPDFFISYTRDHYDQAFPGYRVVHTESVEGVVLCVVKVNPNIQQ